MHARTIPIERIDPDAVKVLRRLTRSGHTAYLVGGGVRDLLLGREPKDFDVATSARPNEVRSLFRNCRVIGRRFRLAHILFAGGKVIEVATFRRDPTEAFDVAEEEAQEVIHAIDADPRAAMDAARRRDDTDLLIRNDNVFGEPHEDAIRRDFTINGLFYDIDRNEVIDYVSGIDDLERRVVSTIGAPDVRFREDPIRILRAVKFSARCDLGIRPDVYDAMVQLRSELRKSAKPRVLEEILRLLRGGAAHRSIYLAWDVGALGIVLPELAAFLDDDAPGAEMLWRRLDVIDERFAEGRLPADTVLLAALLLGPLQEAMDGAPNPGEAFEGFIDDLTQRLALPRRQRDRMRLLLLAQRRLRNGKMQTISRRDFFYEAATLYAIDLEAAGKEVPTWASDPDAPPPDSGVARRPRRRRRRGPE